MSASALFPTPPTTLVIVLGASAWPNSPGFQASRAFMYAAQGFRNYVLDPQGFGLPEANLLDQFDALASASDQLELLGSFLERRTQALKAANQVVRDVLVYFVGHGGFAGPSSDFYLLLRRTNVSSLRASGIGIDALAEVLREKARQTRRYLFLDCCFAAAAFRAFQGGPDQTAITKTLDAFRVRARGSGVPGRGTVLLCSSDQKSPSLLLPDESCTMFSYALLDVLKNGDLHRPRQLSLRDIKELAEDRLAALPEQNAPRPGLYSPDQSEGDAADIPFFPNPRGERKRYRQTEEAEQARFAVDNRMQNIEKQTPPKPESVGFLTPVSPLAEDKLEIDVPEILQRFHREKSEGERSHRSRHTAGSELKDSLNNRRRIRPNDLSGMLRYMEFKSGGELEILRRIRQEDIPASWRAVRPTKNRLLWHSIRYYSDSEEGGTWLGITVVSVILFAPFLLGILAAVIGSLILFLVGYGIVLATACAVIGILSWREATRSVLVVTPDRFLWGNWEKVHVEKAFRYRDYTSLNSVEGYLAAISEVWDGKVHRTIEKEEYISFPALFELSRDLARTIADAHKQFLRSNQGNA